MLHVACWSDVLLDLLDLSVPACSLEVPNLKLLLDTDTIHGIGINLISVSSAIGIGSERSQTPVEPLAIVISRIDLELSTLNLRHLNVIVVACIVDCTVRLE